MASAASRTSPSYTGLSPASRRASKAAKGASRKRDTRCELLLRRALWALGLRYRVAVPSLPGTPDIVLTKFRLVVFCDGDFWHGRNLDARLAKLNKGHNGAYWAAKIRRNVERDRMHDALLEAMGWRVLRLWETDIVKNPDGLAKEVRRLALAA